MMESMTASMLYEVGGSSTEFSGTTPDSSHDGSSAFDLSAFALATSGERDRRRRKVLVQRMVKLVLEAPSVTTEETEEGKPSATTTPTSPSSLQRALTESQDFSKEEIAARIGNPPLGTEILGPSQPLEDAPQPKLPVSSSAQATRLEEEILGQETGSTTISRSTGVVSSVHPSSTTRIRWNREQPLTLHWIWQTTHDGQGAVAHSTCNLSLLAREGITIEFSAAPKPPTAINAEAHAEAKANEYLPAAPETKIAVCEISRFQWTLEGSTKKASVDGDNEEGFGDVQSFWKLENATLSLAVGSVGDVAAEEVLLEGSDISLIGQIRNNAGSEAEALPPPYLQLQPKSILSLKVSSVGSLGGSEEEKRRVGFALRSMVNFLDQIVSVPNLHLSLTDTSDKGEGESPGGINSSSNSEENKIPSFEEAGDGSSLGHAMKYYLKYYCSGTNNDAAAAGVFRSTRFLTMGDSVAAFGAMAATGTSMISPIGAAVSVAALAAKDGVQAAARKGKEVRLSRQHQPSSIAGSSANGGNELANRISLDFGNGEAPSTPTVLDSHKDDGYKFGDVARGVLGTIREKHQQRQTAQSLHSPLETNDNGNYLTENKGRFAGIAGGTAGAVAGLAVAGPIGAMAGSFFGSMGSQAAVQKQEELAQSNGGIASGESATAANTAGFGGFRFGDNFRRAVARGKEVTEVAVARGKEATGNASEKLDGFSRGLIRSTRANRDNENGGGKGVATPSKIGESFRGMLAKGKEASTSAKFGDLSWGLYAKARGMEEEPEPPPPKLHVLNQIDLPEITTPAPREAESVVAENRAVQDITGAAGSQPNVSEAALGQLMDMGFSRNGCTRALLAVGGSDIESAMDWILNHNMDTDFNAPLP